MDGKKFEKLIKQSCEEQGVDVTRLHDAGSYVGGKQTGEGRRFTTKNLCDFIIFNHGVIAYIEAKRRDSSLTFKDITQRSALMKKHDSNKQGDMLRAGLFVYFAKPGECWWVPAASIDDLEKDTGKKSFNAKDCVANPSCVKVEMFVPRGKRASRLDMLGYFKG